MDKVGGTRIVLLLHPANMGVNSDTLHTSPTGHTSEHHRWAGGHHSAVGTHTCSGYTYSGYGTSAVNVNGAGAIK